MGYKVFIVCDKNSVSLSSNAELKPISLIPFGFVSIF